MSKKKDNPVVRENGVIKTGVSFQPDVWMEIERIMVHQGKRRSEVIDDAIRFIHGMPPKKIKTRRV